MNGKHKHPQAPVEEDAFQRSFSDLRQHHFIHVGRYGLLAIIIFGFYAVGLRWDIAFISASSAQSDSAAKVGGVPAPMKVQAQITRAPAVDNEVVTLPTIWPKFTRLYSSTRLYVLAGNMLPNSWSTTVHNEAGSWTMVASVVQRGGGRVLEILADGLGRKALGFLEASGFELHGMGGTVLGRMVSTPDGRIVLVGGDGKEVCTVAGAPWGSFAEVRTPNGKVVGVMSRRAPTACTPQEHLEISIEPGVDHVFVLLCIVGLAAFGKPEAPVVA